MSVNELAAIVAGSIVGGLVLLVIAVVVYLLCWKRKPDKRGHWKKHRPMSPHVSPNHSQPSTLVMPKVNSTGLWIGTPGMYAGTQSPAYIYGRPHNLSDPKSVSRAISEARLAHPRPPRHAYGPNPVYMLPVYTAQRIYHSQPLSSMYDTPPIQGMAMYDAYNFGDSPRGSRSKLLGSRYTSQNYNFNEFKLTSKLERSKSDARDRHSPRHEPNLANQVTKTGMLTSLARNGVRQPSRQFSKTNEVKAMQTGKGAGSDKRKVTPEYIHRGHDNNAFAPDSTYLPNGTSGMVTSRIPTSAITPLATDSMKLLANNKTDDQKTEPVISSSVKDKVDNKYANDINYRHYEYEGDIYALSTKTTVNNKDEDDGNNPLLNRMKEMVTEKIRSSNLSNPREHSGAGYQITKKTKVVKTEVIESYAPDAGGKGDQVEANIKSPNALELPDLSQSEKSQVSGLSTTKPWLPPLIKVMNENKKVETIVMASDEPDGAAKITRIHKTPSPLPGQDRDEDGKEITASAFQFLDIYLTDDDGTESNIGSPPLSPGLFRAKVSS